MRCGRFWRLPRVGLFLLWLLHRKRLGEEGEKGGRKVKDSERKKKRSKRSKHERTGFLNVKKSGVAACKNAEVGDVH
jgi:hypothetical protein